MNSKTFLAKKEEIKRRWHLVDGSGKVLGRLATVAANTLRGKDKRIYTPSVDCGDFVVVTNAEKIILTGKKLIQKMDFRHSGYPGGDRFMSYEKLMKTNPEKAVKLAVMGMLPDNKLAARQLTRLKVFRGPEHKHAAQFATPATTDATAK